MKSEKITLEFEGLESLDGHVDLNVFVNELTSLRISLQKIDKGLNNKVSTQFVVSDLSHSSPARVTIEPIHLGDDPSASSRVLEEFSNVINSIALGEIEEETNYSVLESLFQLSEPVGRTLSTAKVEVGGQDFEINTRFRDNIGQALEREEVCIGSIEGALEQINLHGRSKHFTIYPVVGPSKVKCIFPQKLHDEAVGNIEKRVTVFGKLKFRPKAPFPHEILVDHISPSAPDSELPSFADLRGLVKDSNETPTEDLIREVRNEWG